MIRLIFSLALLVGLVLPARAEFDETAYTPYELDEMLENFKASRPGSVEITMFKPLRFEGDVVGLPEPKKTDYVQRLIRDFAKRGAHGELPAVTHGMRIRSPQGQEYSLYVMDDLVPQANELLIPGDKATFYVYHAYNAKNGPGLVLQSFLRHPRPTAWDKAVSWFQSLSQSQE